MNSQFFFRITIAGLLLILNVCVKAQVVQLNDVRTAFGSINTKPKIYSFKSKYKAPAGGHLQGIQPYHAYEKPFSGQIVLTGSSNSYSYYLKAHLNGHVDTLAKIAGSPFRHAGGCQVVNPNLVVGVEDNIAKDKSQLTAIRLVDTIETEVLKIRQGQFKRSTAGAVGCASVKSNFFLFAIGDWDTRNIDFYSLDEQTGFDSIATFSFGVAGPPCSYQSINLVTDTNNHIYLIGLGKDGNTNRADLYAVENYKLTLVATRLFKTNNGCSFRYGAGINCNTAQSLQIYTCQRRLKKNNKVNVFGSATEVGRPN
jgi:hypothetical protein